MFLWYILQCLHIIAYLIDFYVFRYPERNRFLCSNRRCTVAISLSYILPFFICSPTYLVFWIKSTKIMEDKEYILYHTSFSDLALKHDSYLVFNFWMYAVVVKLLPCCILTVLSIWLIRTIFKAKKRKQVLMLYYSCPVTDTNNKKKTKSERRAERTTKMLVAVLFLFLLTEFPQGIFGVLIGMKGKCFFIKCYQNFGEVMDILALINGAINFILYCCMNRMFRITFGQLFRSSILIKWPLPLAPASEVHTTYVWTWPMFKYDVWLWVIIYEIYDV